MQISRRLRKLTLVFLGFLIMLFGKLVEELTISGNVKMG